MLACLVLASLCVGWVSATVVCPNGHVCSVMNTCCLAKEGYGCCIYPSAVCCSDLLHCCPAGYYCNAESQLCVRDSLPWYRLPWLKNTPAKEPETTPFQLSLPRSDGSTSQESSSDVSVVLCDNGHVCPDGTTCCRNPYGTWSCCHAAKYTLDLCCLSEVGCCQLGFHCDRELKACVRDSAPPVPRATVEQAPGDGSLALEGVIRCDGHFYCPAGNSCCKAPTGDWGCCPYPLGQCCLDGKHCCEFDWTCDSNSTNCVKGDTSIPSATRREIQRL
ncbi:granulin 1 isoform X2 [Clupea harengus]|nr:granulin 1 isoform X2 [Clupea harengus]